MLARKKNAAKEEKEEGNLPRDEGEGLTAACAAGAGAGTAPAALPAVAGRNDTVGRLDDIMAPALDTDAHIHTRAHGEIHDSQKYAFVNREGNFKFAQPPVPEVFVKTVVFFK